MTTLQSWISFSDTGEDAHLPRAVYLASDSRITWGSAEHRWEAGRKVFASSTLPHIFGFSGDVVLPGLILGQLITAIDAGILFSGLAPPDDQHRAVIEAIQRGVACAVNTPTLDFTIHHLARVRDWPDTSFRAWTINYTAETGDCLSVEVGLPMSTAIIGSYGSGRNAAKVHLNNWGDSDAAGRSRAILSAFHDSIRSGDDPLSGGAPQLAALYTSGTPAQIGIVVAGKCYLNGLEVEVTPLLGQLEWRDELGQNVDPVTCMAVPGARRFARPKKLRRKP